jgi:uroporphyrin-III C-methyltransferase / precorrin-2 dehydrogenase / sirohydrochlorin ferrochelatase
MKPQSRLPQQNNPARIEPLAVLPVFLDLHGKTAIVVGASEGALWKAELLLQAGASVTLVCEKPTAAILQWVSNAKTGRVLIEATSWRDVSFGDAALVVADVQKPEAAELAAKAKAAGALVNIVDQPAHCQFQFGSIVNKSPLVIGISTGGAAPVLAQLVRSLVETALPDSLQALARKAVALRSRVNERLHGAHQRRRYWNAFFARAFGKMPEKQTHSPQGYSIFASEVGDLTLRDLEMLRRADHILCRPGANPAITALARREAQRFSTHRRAAENAASGLLVTIGALAGHL